MWKSRRIIPLEERQEIQESLDKNGKEQKTDLSDMPNLFVIINEAFSDLSIYGDFGISEDAMPFLHSLEREYSPGGTCMFR